MAADGMIGNGSRVGFSANSPVSWTRIGQLLNLDGLEFVRDKVDRTVHSTNIYKRNLPGMAEVSDLVLEILADPDEGEAQGVVQEQLRSMAKSGTNYYWRTEVPVDRTQTQAKPYEWRGWVQRFKHATPIEGRQVFHVTVVYDADSFDSMGTGAFEIT